MSIADLPILSMLRTRMQWHQARQQVLAENVANAETPRFRPRDLVPPPRAQTGGASSAPIALAGTSAAHFRGSGGGQDFEASGKGLYEVRPSGNAVNLEDEMIKVAANQMDYQAATALYTRSMALIKTALGKR